jgi:predicted house-cleaning NTP pyrophosphatase (Maf/HAM1 superfamily)
MEPKKVEFVSTDVTFHSRDLRPTQSFERAKEKADAKCSKIVRVYGIPNLVIDPETNLVYFNLGFSDEITKKIQNGELVIKSDTPFLIDEETQKKMDNKEKRRLKDSTKVWRKS